MALPPRKLDIYTLALLSGTFIGANQLSAEYTEMSILQRFGSRMQSITSTSLPPKAVEIQARLRAEKERREAAQNGNSMLGKIVAEEQTSVLKEVEKMRADEAAGKHNTTDKSILEKVWLGGEGNDWKAKRDQREKEALEQGRGYGDLIMDQIWEVWSWGKGKGEEVITDEKQQHKEGKR
jgi:hypothetical protein